MSSQNANRGTPTYSYSDRLPPILQSSDRYFLPQHDRDPAEQWDSQHYPRHQNEELPGTRSQSSTRSERRASWCDFPPDRHLPSPGVVSRQSTSSMSGRRYNGASLIQHDHPRLTESQYASTGLRFLERTVPRFATWFRLAACLGTAAESLQ